MRWAVACAMLGIVLMSGCGAGDGPNFSTPARSHTGSGGSSPATDTGGGTTEPRVPGGSTPPSPPTPGGVIVTGGQEQSPL